MNDFLNPSAAYRGVPFWSWNCRVTKELIDAQVGCFQKMGMGGAMIHPRTGLDTPYLGDEYMELVAYAERRLREAGMSCWLYDEERFPSGCAGGLVTRDARYRARWILVTNEKQDGFCENRASFDELCASGEKPRGYHLCDYQIQWENGRLSTYQKVGREDDGNRHAYVELMAESPWFNGETYVDVMNPEATDAFLAITHERYAAALGEQFGRNVPAIFTDEPHMKGKYCLPTPEAPRATLAYTEGLEDAFREAWGRELTDILPELIWEVKEGYSPWRYRYHEMVTERFAAAYGDRIGEWCEAHGIAYTGHFLSERTLYSQTLALGETMRQYRSEHLPGIDILAGQLELTTVKQAESVRRQMGRESLVCELYGVLEWDVTFLKHKLQGDWLAALGVTTRVHHLAYMQMDGEAKRDWPAAIGWQSPWWTRYAWLEDYFARINTQLTRGKPLCHVAVVHPIESFWLLFGPNSQTQSRREEMDRQFEQLAQWLLYGGIDYDYLSEALLPGLCPAGGNPLRVGECAYDAVIVPPILTLRESTLERLERFAAEGGRLILLGEAPPLTDGVPSDRAKALWDRGLRLPMERAALLETLDGVREIEIRNRRTGRLSDNVFHQLREDGESRILFLCHVREEKAPKPREYEIRIRGLWRARRLDALTGETGPMGGRQENGYTVIPWPCHAQDSLLLELTPGKCEAPDSGPRPYRTIRVFREADSYTMEEPNALLLDRCEYALDEGGWQGPEEILRADNALRTQCGLPLRNGDQVQPWMTPGEKATHTACLRYTFHAEQAFSDLRLAMEQPENAQITLNGQDLRPVPDGHYVDACLQTLPLPPLAAGKNTLELTIPLSRRTNLESLYVLGDFGVQIAGTRMTLTAPATRLALDDLTSQGFPFYTGNLRYQFRFLLEEDREGMALHIPHMACPVAAVSVDGKEAGLVAWEPYQVALPKLKQGEHVIEITAYGNRYNGFGPLHNDNPNYMWYGPDAWRTRGDEWTDNYRVRPSYLLSPITLMEETK